jgi:hypothetical protein
MRKVVTTDLWLIILHWIAAGAVLVSAASGLRIAADDPRATISRWLAPVLLDGPVHRVHVLSGMILLSAAAAYYGYLRHARLFKHLRLPPTSGPANERVTWKRRNIRIHQIQFLLVALLGSTGMLLYFDWAPPAGIPVVWLVDLHLLLAWSLLATTALHVLAQYEFGATAGHGMADRIRSGLGWLLKMLRPRVDGWGARRTLHVHPITAIVALGIGVAVSSGMVAVDRLAHQRVRVATLDAARAPSLDGIANDLAWQGLKVARVMTRAGANLPDGQSPVEVTAAHDAQNIYLLFRWQDTTRSLKHLPLQKTEAGWRLLHEEYDIEDEDLYYEDKFAVLLSTDPDFGAKASHLGPRPLADKPAPLSGRGLHYTTSGAVADMWQWKAVRSEPLGFLDDDSFGPPAEPKADELAGKVRYKGGYVTDPGAIGSKNNFAHEGPGGYHGEVTPTRLPTDLTAMQARLGAIDLDSQMSDLVALWMTEAETAPFSPELDAAIPVGTVIPGILLNPEVGIEGDRGDVRAAAQWHAGWWTLEVSRRLDTGSAKDVAFGPGQPTYLWVSVFDHSQTRHSRHMRPFEIILPSPPAA